MSFEGAPDAAATHQGLRVEQRASQLPYKNVSSHLPSQHKYVANPAPSGAPARPIAGGDPAHGLLKGTLQDAVFVEDRSNAGRGSLVFSVVVESTEHVGLLPIKLAFELGPLKQGDKVQLKVIGSDGLHLQLALAEGGGMTSNQNAWSQTARSIEEELFPKDP